MAFRTFIKSTGKTLRPDKTLKWGLFKDKEDNLFGSICCPKGCGPLQALKTGWLFCPEGDCPWQSDAWYWENIFYTKAGDEFRDKTLLIGKCPHHGDGIPDSSNVDFSRFITGGKYAFTSGSSKKSNQRIKKSMRVEISTADENFGRLRAYCTGPNSKEKCTFSTWLDDIEENKDILFKGTLSNWMNDISDDEKYSEEQQEYFRNLINEVKFVRGCYLGCISVIRPLMSRAKLGDQMLMIVKDILKYAAENTENVSNTYQAIQPLSNSSLSDSVVGVFCPTIFSIDILFVLLYMYAQHKCPHEVELLD